MQDETPASIVSITRRRKKKKGSKSMVCSNQRSVNDGLVARIGDNGQLNARREKAREVKKKKSRPGKPPPLNDPAEEGLLEKCLKNLNVRTL